ncbi:MAG: FAD-binding oxidoreductase [Thermoflexales bacterium]
MTSLDQRLAGAIGADRVLADPADTVAYRLGPHTPAAVVAPASVDELAAAMAIAHEARASVVPWGGGTRQTYGRPVTPNGPLIVLRTTGLNRVLDYNPDDLAISVEAGVTMASLRDTLAQHRQMLPIDVPLPDRATLGGTLALDADGPRRAGYGTNRDLLVGVRVVEATGRSSKAGGIVVKNVSGFDMMKLYIGSAGTLAIIASANFKLLPIARASASLDCVFPSLDAAFTCIDALHASQLVPTACELSNCGWMPAGELRLAVLVEGLPAAVERQRSEIGRMAIAAGALETSDARALWSRIGDFPRAGAGDTLLRVACLPSQLAAAIGAAGALAARFGLRLRYTARALSGVVYARVDGGDPRAWLHALRDTLPAANLAILDPAGDAGGMPDSLSFGRRPEGLALMRRIKAEFDPKGLLNPGRFLVDAAS